MTVVPPIVEEPNQNGKDPNDEGILKALKDLEWEVSEILTEKVCVLLYVVPMIQPEHNGHL